MFRNHLARSLRASCSIHAHRPFSSGLQPLGMLTEEEEMIRETVQRFANNVVKPKVREMDENEQMDPQIIKGLFEQGV